MVRKRTLRKNDNNNPAMIQVKNLEEYIPKLPQDAGFSENIKV